MSVTFDPSGHIIFDEFEENLVVSLRNYPDRLDAFASKKKQKATHQRLKDLDEWYTAVLPKKLAKEHAISLSELVDLTEWKMTRFVGLSLSPYVTGVFGGLKIRQYNPFQFVIHTCLVGCKQQRRNCTEHQQNGI